MRVLRHDIHSVLLKNRLKNLQTSSKNAQTPPQNAFEIPKELQTSSKSAQTPPQNAPESIKEPQISKKKPRCRPKTPRDRPREPQTSSKSAQTPPKEAPEPPRKASKNGFGRLLTGPCQKETLSARNFEDFGPLWGPFLAPFWSVFGKPMSNHIVYV